MPKLTKKQLIEAKKIYLSSLNIDDLGKQVDLVALENKVNGQTPLSINKYLLAESLKKYSEEKSKAEPNEDLVSQYLTESLGHLFAIRKTGFGQFREIEKIDQDFTKQTEITQKQIDFGFTKIAGNIEKAELDAIDENGFPVFDKIEAAINAKKEFDSKLEDPNAFLEDIIIEDLEEYDKNKDKIDMHISASLIAEEKHERIIKDINDEFEKRSVENPVNNVLFDRAFFENFQEDNPAINFITRDNGKDDPWYKIVSDSNKEQKQFESAALKIEEQRNIAKKRIENYLTIKTKIQNRTWGDIFAHPWNSLMENITLYQTKKTLTECYGFTNEGLDEIEKICRAKSVDSDLFVIQKDGTKVSESVTDEDVQREYDLLKKEEAIKEKKIAPIGDSIITGQGHYDLENKKEANKKLASLGDDTNMSYDNSSIGKSEKKNNDIQIDNVIKIKDEI